MCGIAGVLNLKEGEPVAEQQMRRMLAAIRHRGPDEFGIYLDPQVALGSARLSIIDLHAGQQPISNEDQTLWIVFNGEIFNYRELRPGLEARGHQFRTATDTEVLLHLYEEHGPRCLERLNGQFAIAIWDTRKETLFLARDRLGVRPLYYAVAGGALVFGSEIKAILSSSRVCARIDPVAMDQIFTFWSTLSPRTAFRDIQEVPPGSYLLAQYGNIRVQRYWQLGFDPAAPTRQPDTNPYLDEFRELMTDATRIRLRADVPVGAYLSGGLDSSTIAALVQQQGSAQLDTFSIAFSDPEFDESEHQRRMARYLGTNHQVVSVAHADIGRVFPEVIWHAETPLMRTAPAPMFLLSRLVHERGYKVVLTGEGADEFLAGYEIFKETAVRRFWARQPDSQHRPRLLRRLYADIPGLANVNSELLSAFFRPGLEQVSSPGYSHAIRWRNTRRATRFFSADVMQAAERETPDPVQSIEYPAGFQHWAPLERAQYLESTIFLSQYLLSSQGDRMAMAHSVEGRFPFLDHRVVEFCTRLPSHLKLNGLKEKFLLKKLGRELLPDDIAQRPKRPYRAPIHRAFFNGRRPDYLADLLSPSRVREAGLFNAAAVSGIVGKLERGMPLGEADDMALAGIISTQLVMEQFVWDFRVPPPLDGDARVKLCMGKELVRI
jgi:asparagine synthase (glutamine-hydrolysing)